VLLAIGLAACSVSQPSPGPTGTNAATASGSASASTSTAVPTTPATTAADVSADSRPGTFWQVPSLESAPKLVWRKSEAALLGGTDTKDLMLLQGSFFPGAWNPANGGRWIALLATSTTSVRVRSIALATGTTQWESVLNGRTGRCVVNAGPEMVCSTTGGLVFFDLATGKSRTVPIAGVAGVALDASGDVVTLSWPGSADVTTPQTTPTAAPRAVALQRVGSDGAVRWSAAGTVTAYPRLNVTIASGVVVVSGVNPGTPASTGSLASVVSLARTWSTGQPLAGITDGDPLNPAGRWLLSSPDGKSTRVFDAAGASFTVMGSPVGGFLGALGAFDSIPRDVAPSALPLLTLTAESNVPVLHAYDARGTELWTSAGDETPAAFCGGLLLTTGNAKITARDPATGAIRWQTGTGRVDACDGTRALIEGDTTRAVELATGRDLWQVSLPVGFTDASASGLLIEAGKEDIEYLVYR
jgi:hypothetical protein